MAGADIPSRSEAGREGRCAAGEGRGGGHVSTYHCGAVSLVPAAGRVAAAATAAVASRVGRGGTAVHATGGGGRQGAAGSARRRRCRLGRVPRAARGLCADLRTSGAARVSSGQRDRGQLALNGATGGRSTVSTHSGGDPAIATQYATRA